MWGGSPIKKYEGGRKKKRCVWGVAKYKYAGGPAKKLKYVGVVNDFFPFRLLRISNGIDLMLYTIIFIIINYIYFTECKATEVESNYFGSVSTTQEGIECQPWDSQSPHPHHFTDASCFPDASLADASYFCRNPLPSREGGPWCFTSSPEVEWSYCHVPLCKGNQPKTKCQLELLFYSCDM